MVITIILLIGLVLFLFWYFTKAKKLQCEAVSMVTGGVKTGKSTLSVYLAIKHYKKNHFRWKIRSTFQKLLGKKVDEEPLLYSNIPLKKVKYVPVTNDILNRTKRINFGSVMYLGEFSLIADSQCYKDDELNERLMLFIKLFGHETHGKGKVFIDTQSIGDCHYAIKRCISRYIYIERSIKWIPFILIYKVRELIYSDDGSTMNTFNKDIEDDTKTLIIFKSVWKKFDYCCYSAFTDHLESVNKTKKIKSSTATLKAKKIPSFKKYKTINLEEATNNGQQKVVQ